MIVCREISNLTLDLGYAATSSKELKNLMPEVERGGLRDLLGHDGVLRCKPESLHGTDATSYFPREKTRTVAFAQRLPRLYRNVYAPRAADTAATSLNCDRDSDLSYDNRSGAFDQAFLRRRRRSALVTERPGTLTQEQRARSLRSG